ncbi:unnamed protein product [Amoebophrya sp. A120]|nr:unnamed protein product [Amoebophrya sp. A120]|eukprot:GSA120T00004090001.1
MTMLNVPDEQMVYSVEDTTTNPIAEKMELNDEAETTTGATVTTKTSLQVEPQDEGHHSSPELPSTAAQEQVSPDKNPAEAFDGMTEQEKPATAAVVSAPPPVAQAPPVVAAPPQQQYYQHAYGHSSTSHPVVHQHPQGYYYYTADTPGDDEDRNKHHYQTTADGAAEHAGADAETASPPRTACGCSPGVVALLIVLAVAAVCAGVFVAWWQAAKNAQEKDDGAAAVRPGPVARPPAPVVTPPLPGVSPGVVPLPAGPKPPARGTTTPDGNGRTPDGNGTTPNNNAPPAPTGPMAKKQASNLVSNDPDEAVFVPPTTPASWYAVPISGFLRPSVTFATDTYEPLLSVSDKIALLSWLAHIQHDQDPFRLGGGAQAILGIAADESLKHHFVNNITQDRVHLAYRGTAAVVPWDRTGLTSRLRTGENPDEAYSSTNGVLWYLHQLFQNDWRPATLRTETTTGFAPEGTYNWGQRSSLFGISYPVTVPEIRPKRLNRTWDAVDKLYDVGSSGASWTALQVNAFKYRLKARFEDLLAVRIHHEDLDDLFKQHALDTTTITTYYSPRWAEATYELTETKVRKIVMTMFWALLLARIRIGRKIIQRENDTWTNPETFRMEFDNPHSDAEKMGVGNWGFDRTIFGPPKVLFHYTSRTSFLAIRSSGSLRPAESSVLGPGVYLTNMEQGLFAEFEVEQETTVGESCVFAFDVDALSQKQGFYLDRFLDERRGDSGRSFTSSRRVAGSYGNIVLGSHNFPTYLKNTKKGPKPGILTDGNPSGTQHQNVTDWFVEKRGKEIEWELKTNLPVSGTYLDGATDHWRARKRAAYSNTRGRRGRATATGSASLSEDVEPPALTENFGSVMLNQLDKGIDYIGVCNLDIPNGENTGILSEWVAVKEGRATRRPPRPTAV